MDRARQRGTTLLDLLTALGVAAITLSIGIPGLRGLVLDTRQTTAVNDMVATMHYARAESVNRNQRVTVCASAGGVDCEPVAWQQGWLVFIDANADGRVDPAETVLRVAGEHASTRISSAGLPGYFIYRPNGRLMVDSPEEATAELTFCDARGTDRARVVVVQRSGRPSSGNHLLDGHRPLCS